MCETGWVHVILVSWVCLWMLRLVFSTVGDNSSPSKWIHFLLRLAKSILELMIDGGVLKMDCTLMDGCRVWLLHLDIYIHQIYVNGITFQINGWYVCRWCPRVIAGVMMMNGGLSLGLSVDGDEVDIAILGLEELSNLVGWVDVVLVWDNNIYQWSWMDNYSRVPPISSGTHFS